MSGCLRSLKLCMVRPEARAGVAGWVKTRLRRARWLVPPGNAVLRLWGAGYRVCGRDWARYETDTFGRVHPEFAAPAMLTRETIWLPDLPGRVLKDLGPERRAAALPAAFAELGRLHRLGLAHGDPHPGNFLQDAGGRCRILDFETRAPAADVRTMALDAAILVLDFLRDEAVRVSAGDWRSWPESMGNPQIAAETIRLLERPGRRLRLYWRMLGYRLPVAPAR